MGRFELGISRSWKLRDSDMIVLEGDLENEEIPVYMSDLGGRLRSKRLTSGIRVIEGWNARLRKTRITLRHVGFYGNGDPAFHMTWLPSATTWEEGQEP